MSLQPQVQQLVSQAQKPLPLTRHSMRQPTRSIHPGDAPEYFPNARHPAAALAGLALQLGDWETAHSIAQDVDTPEGSYWHAIIHRLEPDYGNARYWFRLVGDHPIFRSLPPTCEPEAFLSQVRQAIQSQDPGQLQAALALQQLEIDHLWAYCIQPK